MGVKDLRELLRSCSILAMINLGIRRFLCTRASIFPTCSSRSLPTIRFGSSNSRGLDDGQIAQCLRYFRDPQKWPFPEGKVKYVEDVFALLGAITGDAIFERLLEEHKNTEDGEMTNSFERVRNFYRSEGFDLGEKRGEERGKQERSVEIARNLLSMRMAKPEVAKATGGVRSNYSYLASFAISATPNGVYMDWVVFLPPALPGATRGNP